MGSRWGRPDRRHDPLPDYSNRFLAWMIQTMSRNIRIREEAQMANLERLDALMTEIGEDVSSLVAEVSEKFAELQAAIAALEAGAVTQEQIDALADKAAAVDTALDDFDASFDVPSETPPVEEPPVEEIPA